VTVFRTNQTSFAAGELGENMWARVDLPVYQRASAEIENFVILPHGGLERRRGLELIAEITDPVSADGVKLATFDFRKEQQYVLVILPFLIRIFENDVEIASVATPYPLSELPDLKWVQSGDTMIFVTRNFAPRRLFRGGTLNNPVWTFDTITFVNRPWTRYNQTSSLTVGTLTASTATTLTLNTEPAWVAGHTNQVRVRPVSTSAAYTEITGMAQAATGGTALSSAGTAANAFDNNNATQTLAGANGWVGYAFTGATTVRIVGVRLPVAATYTLVFETANDNAFTTPTVRGTVTFTSVTDQFVYLDVPSFGSDTRFRIRQTAGASPLTVNDVIFATGLVATGVNGPTAIPSAGPHTTWQEEGWSAARGFPRAATFFENRLVFGGTISNPSVIFLSNSGDFFNFDNTSTNDNNAMVYTISTDQVHVIRDLKSKRNLNIFTTDGEFELSGGDDALTPTTVRARQQSSFGISDISALEVDDEILFNTFNFKEIRSFRYVLASDKYEADNKTILAHHLFVDGKEPVAMGYLRSYRDTQSNFLLVSREDGELAILTIDTRREVLAWSRWTTQGLFRELTPCFSLDSSGLREVESIYVITQRNLNGTDRVFLEKWTEDDIYLDHHYTGTSNTPTTTWNGFTTLANETVTVVADGAVAGEFTVNNSGSITLNEPAASIVVGLPYTSRLRTLDLFFELFRQIRTDKPIRKIAATMELKNTVALSVDGKPLFFRPYGNTLLDQPLVPFSGIKQSVLQGYSRDCFLTLETDEPLPATILSIGVKCKQSLGQ
jgi:hypothetical protein